jgi:hypothetical protein
MIALLYEQLQGGVFYCQPGGFSFCLFFLFHRFSKK